MPAHPNKDGFPKTEAEIENQLPQDLDSAMHREWMKENFEDYSIREEAESRGIV